ncbi:hypothetical protein SARC_00701 [Sphaeroforma arctica JP610]|uniref:Uncharacterized protein n=1 Tax=Sphaeroforma arctica JP610 TaxID=667725 RepID=A0A0L0GFW7_9EUKA|nr:hypothetical protein SARC_00701 [Sphaeroforma arctica JP610]KNC87173.1 hypothetical protein SARC_00701 [Sphaeroforma arctica JP610]|eukprot:XP_014161075.1 hypothetical protein SARC_00701 [Sphaeroforma arctica JP610]
MCSKHARSHAHPAYPTYYLWRSAIKAALEERGKDLSASQYAMRMFMTAFRMGLILVKGVSSGPTAATQGKLYLLRTRGGVEQLKAKSAKLQAATKASKLQGFQAPLTRCEEAITSTVANHLPMPAQAYGTQPIPSKTLPMVDHRTREVDASCTYEAPSASSET